MNEVIAVVDMPGSKLQEAGNGSRVAEKRGQVVKFSRSPEGETLGSTEKLQVSRAFVCFRMRIFLEETAVLALGHRRQSG